jgi:hypothetical protein
VEEAFNMNTNRYSVLFARTSDNVLDPKDWPVTALLLRGDTVVWHLHLQSGGSSMPCTGWNTARLLTWASYDGTGKHPEMFHDLKAHGDEEYEYFTNSREKVEAMLERGAV